MQHCWKTKLLIESFLKNRPSWEGNIEIVGDSSVSLTAQPATPTRKVEWQIGDLILGKYKVLEIRGGPGRSGMGIVFIVLDSESGEIYAAKTLQDWCAFNRRARKRFEREAKMWIDLENHPNIVKAHFLEHINDKPYLFLEFVPGADVSTLVKAAPLTIRLAIKFSIQICRAMSHAARRFPGFVHRDIKPSNCLTTQENLKLTDFGLAKAMDRISITMMEGEIPYSQQSSSISVEGRRLGTLPYMAPELFKHGRTHDVRSDIYSFGITMYKMVTSRLPFKSSSPEEWMESHIHLKPIDPIEFVPDLPPIIRDLILKCLEKEPEKRFSKFSEIEELISSVLLKNYGERLPRDTPRKLEIADIINKALSYSKLGLYRQALEFYDRATELDPNLPQGWSGKATVFSQLDLHAEALLCAEKAITLEPDSATNWAIKGKILSEAGNTEEANKCYDIAIELRPKATNIIMEKGENLLKQEDFPDAYQCFKKITEVQPGNFKAWMLRGLAEIEMGRYEDSINSINQVLRGEGQHISIAWASKGDAYFRMGKMKKAEKCFAKAISIEPDSSLFHILLACSLVRMNRIKEAKREFSKAEKNNPEVVKYLKSIDEYKLIEKQL